MDNLRVIENFLSGRELRCRLIETCIAILAEKRLFESPPTVHVDGRWGFLSKALDCLIPRLSTLLNRFDVAKILVTTAGL